MKSGTDQMYGEEYLAYLRDRNVVRKLLRKLYLLDIRSYCTGKTIEFGCGTGELLELLPAGSVGYEVNTEAVNYCRSKNLNVEFYNPAEDDYAFRNIPQETYLTFTMNHVLEHLEDPHLVIKKIFESCNRLGIKRIVFTVPGPKGFRSDKTHLTFIDQKYFRRYGLFENHYFKLRMYKYFPINISSFGRIFTHNELRIVFDKK